MSIKQPKHLAKVHYKSCTWQLRVSYRSGDVLSSSKESYLTTDEACNDS